MFRILAYLRLSNPVSTGELQTVNLQIPLYIYPTLSTYIIASRTNIKNTKY